ncbi:alpha/beta hydrolase [Shimia sp. R10_1]|uniref:alpha/beta fold hydrolase n=1 Tax=Shimia sp. R10_1 TaxID=2821095 RepID=UPI001ADAA287|nr:alpha/beta hydrolase [Shimia sp. R10_1]MBO9475280.1 alpha/beta hydrolase [Shimia sp. R10_1]
MTLTTLQLSEPYGRVTFRVSGQGFPLVLLHGVGMQSAAWYPQVEAFSAHCQVIALDLPGHGGSDTLAGEPALPDYVAWLHAVVTAMRLGPIHLVGHSMGALISAGYTVSHPQRVASVALLNGVFRRSSAARKAVVARANDIQRGCFDLETPLKRWFGDRPAEQKARGKVSDWLSSVNTKGYADAYAAFAAGDEKYADQFSQIRCPLLALTGALDPNSTSEMAEAMADIAPQGHAVIIEGERHMVNLTAPEKVNAILKDWLPTPAAERGTA